MMHQIAMWVCASTNVRPGSPLCGTSVGNPRVRLSKSAKEPGPEMESSERDGLLQIVIEHDRRWIQGGIRRKRAFGNGATSSRQQPVSDTCFRGAAAPRRRTQGLHRINTLPQRNIKYTTATHQYINAMQSHCVRTRTFIFQRPPFPLGPQVGSSTPVMPQLWPVKQ